MTTTKAKTDEDKAPDEDQATADRRDAQITELRAELAAVKAAARVPEVDPNEAERIPYLLTLACGHGATVDNGATSTEHYCASCKKVRKVTGWTLD